MNTIYGYIRVSSESQKNNFSLENQKEKLKKLGVLPENIFEDVGSGLDYNRVNFTSLLEKAQKGDVIYVDKIDRFGRSMREGLELFFKLKSEGITLLSLDLPYVEDTTLHDLIVSLMLFVAQKDYEMRKERQREGIEKARRIAGKYKGRKTVVTPALLKRMEELLPNKCLTKNEVAELLGISRSTLYAVIKKNKNCSKNN